MLQNVAELRGSRRLPELLRTLSDPGALADAVTAWSEVAVEQQIDVLEAIDLGDRVDLVLAWAKEHLAELQVARQIRDGVADGVEKQQREFLLRQQLQAIRKELGEGDDDTGDNYRARLDELTLPVKVREAVEKELDRLERTSGQSPSRAGSARGSTASSTFRGAAPPRTGSTSPRLAPCSTPTMRAWTT